MASKGTVIVTGEAITQAWPLSWYRGRTRGRPQCGPERACCGETALGLTGQDYSRGSARYFCGNLRGLL
jgi:hypothetical protein